MRRAGGGDRRRRAAAAQGNRPDRARARSRARSSSSSAPTRCCWKRRWTCSSPASGSPGRCIWTATARSTTSRSARPASTTARWRRSPSRSARGFRTIINATLFNNAKPEKVAAFFDDVMAMGVDGISVSPGYAYERAPDQQHFLNRSKTKELFRGIFAARARARRSGRSTSRRCSWISWPATRPSIARRGAIRPAPISAGSGPAICWARATRRPSRS